MNYYVYYNKQHHARIHHQSCHYYRNRKENKAHSWWSDEYADLSIAQKAAVIQDSSFYKVRNCSICLDGAEVS